MEPETTTKVGILAIALLASCVVLIVISEILRVLAFNTLSCILASIMGVTFVVAIICLMIFIVGILFFIAQNTNNLNS